MTTLHLDLNDANLLDPLAGFLLGWAPARGDALAERFKAELRAELVRAGRTDGPKMNAGAVLASVVGPGALARLVLANDPRALTQRVIDGVIAPEPAGTKAEPLEVYEEMLPRTSFVMKYAIAPDQDFPGQYTKWCLYERTVHALGITPEGGRAMLRSFRHRAKTFHALLDGHPKRVRCLPAYITLLTLMPFTRDLFRRQPTWTRPECQESLHAFAEELRNVLSPLRAIAGSGRNR